MKKLDLKDYEWRNQPRNFELTDDTLSIQTEPGTDLWQRTHYGFRNDNAPAFLAGVNDDFTFQVKTYFDTNFMYDQCGILMYLDSDNWLKVSVEHENEYYALLGSVVTNLGYSDWASIDIPAMVSKMWYSLSRRGQDFLIENSEDGIHFKQMRILHMHLPINIAWIGVYACSPLQSSFKAVFSKFKIGPCEWAEHN
ncbi:MAG: DUF1349 domain-containing protein [Dysgonamonadaceae bacterium]|nr:DUF1349 domain-containing protein [Dysgonamonadaceae bacterium]